MKRKPWILALATALVLPLAACAGLGPPGNTAPVAESAGQQTQAPDMASSTWKQHTEPVTLTMTSQITEDSKPPFQPPAWGEDAVSRMVMDLTGVKLDIQQQGFLNPPDIQALAAAGDLTDLVCVRLDKDARFLEDSGLCYDLNELAETYCPDFWDDVDPLQQLNNQAGDGKIYTLRNGYFNNSLYADPRIPIDPPWTLNFNQKQLNGRALPASIEELDALLTDSAPAGGPAPLAMLGPTESPLPSWMGIYRDLYWDQTQRKVCTPLRQEGWLDYLSLLSRWYRNGLVAMPTPEELAQDPLGGAGTWVTETLSGNLSQTLVFTATREYNADGGIYASTVTEDDPWPWTLLADPLTYQGKEQLAIADNQATWAYSSPTTSPDISGSSRLISALFITKTCAQPDRAIYFMQFLKGEEGAKLTHWGVEGEHYTRDENGLIAYTAAYQNEKTDGYDSGVPGHSVVPDNGLQYWTFTGNDEVAGILDASPAAYLTNPTALAMRAQRIEAGLRYKQDLSKNKCPVLQFALPLADSSDDTAYRAAVKAWDDAVYAIVTESQSDEDVAQRWEALQGELANMGLDALEEAMTARFSEALKRYHEAGYFTEIQP